jgi:hypothetical protein
MLFSRFECVTRYSHSIFHDYNSEGNVPILHENQFNFALCNDRYIERNVIGFGSNPVESNPNEINRMGLLLL